MASEFLPDPGPGDGTSVSTTAEVWEASFGDGYRQRITKGINPERRTASIVWPTLSADDADTLVAWLEPKLKVEAFRYTIPPSTVEYLWTVQKIERGEIAPKVSTLSIELRQEFDI
jgi:phage-related protein